MTVDLPPEVDVEPPPPPPRGFAVRRVVGVVVAVGLVAAAVLLGAPLLARLVGGPGPTTTTLAAPGQTVSFTVEGGASARQIATDLQAAGIVSASSFRSAVGDAGAESALQAGEYQLETGMSAEEVLAALVEGPPEAETVKVVIPEGLRVVEMLDRLAEDTEIPRADLESALLDGSVTTTLVPQPPDSLAGWEGLLFPATYEIGVDASAAEVLQQLSNTMAARVGEVDWGRFERAGLSRYEGLIIASLVESEAKVARDRRLISSVIRNRLDEGMRLEIDATVLYALGKRGGLTSADLEVDSPYNTRRVAGLPPTPIAAPGSASLQAAASPANTDYLYYVVRNARGAHAFTADYDEFLALKQQAQNRGLIP